MPSTSKMIPVRCRTWNNNMEGEKSNLQGKIIGDRKLIHALLEKK